MILRNVESCAVSSLLNLRSDCPIRDIVVTENIPQIGSRVPSALPCSGGFPSAPSCHHPVRDCERELNCPGARDDVFPVFQRKSSFASRPNRLLRTAGSAVIIAPDGLCSSPRGLGTIQPRINRFSTLFQGKSRCNPVGHQRCNPCP